MPPWARKVVVSFRLALVSRPTCQRRAAAMAAVSPAMPPPSTSTSNWRRSSGRDPARWRCRAAARRSRGGRAADRVVVELGGEIGARRSVLRDVRPDGLASGELGGEPGHVDLRHATRERPELGERHEHEGALPQPRVRQRELGSRRSPHLEKGVYRHRGCADQTAARGHARRHLRAAARRPAARAASEPSSRHTTWFRNGAGRSVLRRGLEDAATPPGRSCPAARRARRGRRAAPQRARPGWRRATRTPPRRALPLAAPAAARPEAKSRSRPAFMRAAVAPRRSSPVGELGAGRRGRRADRRRLLAHCDGQFGQLDARPTADRRSRSPGAPEACRAARRPSPRPDGRDAAIVDRAGEIVGWRSRDTSSGVRRRSRSSVCATRRSSAVTPQ